MENLNQKRVLKAALCAAKAMIEYSYAIPGRDEMEKVADLLGEAIYIMRERLQPNNQEALDQWMHKKASEIRSSEITI